MQLDSGIFGGELPISFGLFGILLFGNKTRLRREWFDDAYVPDEKENQRV